MHNTEVQNNAIDAPVQNNGIDVPTIDIVAYLSEPTQIRAEVSEPNINTDGIEDNNTNALPVVETEPIQLNQAIIDNLQTPAITTAITYDNTKLAATIIDLADSVLTASAPVIYQACLNKNDRKILKRLAARVKRDKNLVLTEADQDILLINEDIDNYTEAMPLTDAEKNSIKEPLAEVLKTIDYKTTPQNALIMACGMVALPRVLPLLPLLIKPKN